MLVINVLVTLILKIDLVYSLKMETPHIHCVLQV